MKKGTIINVIVEKVGRFVMGTNWVKGDYIEVTPQYMAKVAGHIGRVALNRSKILAFTGGKRVTEKKLASLAGKMVADFI